jgi:hypothetical protein
VHTPHVPLTLRMKVVLDRAEDVALLVKDQAPSARGWSIGSTGVFQNGALVSRNGSLRIHALSAGGLPHVDLLIFEDSTSDS